MGSGFAAAAPAPLRLARVDAVPALPPLPFFVAVASFVAVVTLASLPAFDRGFVGALARPLLAFAFASAMTAFVSGDVSRVAAFANLASPAR